MTALRSLALETEAVARLRAAIVEQAGEDADLIRDTIEGASDLNTMLGLAARELAIVEGEKEGVEIAIAKIKERLTRHCNKAQAIRTAMEKAMVLAELTSLKTATATLSMRTSPPRVEISDPAELPAVYMVQPPPAPDKRAIMAALKDGTAVPGASLSNQPPALSIRFT